MKHFSGKISMLYSFLFLIISGASAQPSAKEIRGVAPVVQLSNEAPPKLIVDNPLPEDLAFGRVIIQYRTENLRIVPVYGKGAIEVSPRIGHLHVTVDNAPWHWADASNEPIIIVGMTPGEHNVLIELADPTHKTILSKRVSFVVPDVKKNHTSQH